MRKRRFVSDSEFTEAKLPHTRPQVFSSVFKTRFLYIFKISLILTAFFLPLFVWNAFMRFAMDDIALTLADDLSNEADVLLSTFRYVLLKDLVSIPLFCIASIGLGGAIHAFQKLAWNEICLVIDFFDGMKKNIIKHIFRGFFFGLSYLLFEVVLCGVPLTDLSFMLRSICYGLGVVQLLYVWLIVFYAYLQNEYYVLKPINSFSNAFKFSFRSFFPSMLFSLIIFLPYAVVFIKIRILYFGGIAFFLFLAPLGLISLILFGDYLFDKTINKISYPEVYDKGIYRMSETADKNN